MKNLENLLNKRGKLSVKDESWLQEIIERSRRTNSVEVRLTRKNSWGNVRDIIPAGHLLKFVESLGLPCTVANDAPRGGRIGKHFVFEITEEQIQEIKDFIAEYHTVTKAEKELTKQQAAIKEQFKDAKIEDVTEDDIATFITHNKESEAIYALRKKLGLSFKNMRKYFIEELEK